LNTFRSLCPLAIFSAR